VDVLAEALRLTGARGSVGTRLEAGGLWGLWLDGVPGAALHLVTTGSLWLNVPGERPREVRAGDAVLLPEGLAHGLSSRPGVTMGACDRAQAARARSAGDVLRLGSEPAGTSLITLHYAQDPEVSTPFLAAMTTAAHVTAGEQPSLSDTARLLTSELAHPQVGTTAMLNSIIDLLLIQFVRVWLAGQPARHSPSWLGGLRDPVIGGALAELHGRPAHGWTTANLAAAIGVSRATLSRRFLAATGTTPGAYLTDWRMDLAAARLRDTDESVEAIAAAVGYTSPHAFSRAFRRTRGSAPGEYRAAVRRTAA
jgi:AraC-like DNA-binding protein